MSKFFSARFLITAFFLFFFQQAELFAQQIVEVGVGEYFTTFRTDDGKLFTTKWGNSIPALYDYGLRDVIDVDGAQYTNVALTASGEVYVVGMHQTVNPYANLIATDYLGNPFLENTNVYGLYGCYFSLRNGNVWYWGINDVLNKNGGADIIAPIQLVQPPGKTIVKLVTASPTTFNEFTKVLGLASDGTVWEWNRSQNDPVEIDFPGSVAENIASVAHFAFIIKTANNLFTWGYDPTYVGARSRWVVSGIQSIKSVWQNAGCVWPIKEMVGNYNTLHIIDANDNMWAAGSNPQGELGNGIEFTPWRTASSPWQWDFGLGQLLTPPTQIPGKYKNICSGNTIAFYVYAQDMGNNWYSWGRNKSLSLGNGITLSINDYAIYSEALNVPAPTLVTPLSQLWTVVPFNPWVQPPPFAHAGINQYISTNETMLYGSGSWQQDGSLTNYHWTKIQGTGGDILQPDSVNTNVTGLSTGTYIFRMTVKNTLGDTASRDVTVMVNSPNQLPNANAGTDQMITLPLNVVHFYGNASDPDGTIAAYVWNKISGPSAGTFTNAFSDSTTVNGLTQGLYKFQLSVTDNSGGISRDTIVLLINPQPNDLPSAYAGADQTITLPINTVSLSGVGTDPDGTIVNFTWTKISGPANGVIVNAFSANTNINGLSQGVYKFQLTVTDDLGGTARDTLMVTVNPAPNQLPSANAGADQTITLPINTVSLSGVGTDPDGTIINYAWTKISGPATGTISNSAAASTTVNALSQGVYKFQLTVTDNSGAIARDTMMVTVNPAPNQLPTANAGNDQTITLPTNTINLAGTGADPDGTIINYAWIKISGPASGTISNSAAATTTVYALSQGIYKYQFTVTDNSGTIARDTMVVTVNPAPNQLPTANAGADQTITLPINTVSLSGVGTDPDGTIVSYTWIKISGPATGTISNSAAATTTVNALSQGIYKYQFTVTDNSGAIVRDTMIVTVNPAPNQLPFSNAGSDQIINLPTNTINLIGTGTDPDGTIVSYIWTKISGPATGTISNSAIATTTVNALSQGIYTYSLTVTDNGGAIARDTMIVTVNPAPNQLPFANAGVDQTINLPLNSIILSGTGTDPDGTIVSYAWTKISGPATVTISNSSSATTTVNALSQGIYKFQLTVTDNSGTIARDTIFVTVNPAPNQLPSANAGVDQTITLPTNTINLIGTGTDPDGTIVSYAWTKISGPATGTISNPSASNTNVNALTQGLYKYTLTVTDNNGAIARDTIHVTVNPPANQLPVANAGFDQTIALPLSTIAVNGIASDPDGTIISYLWTKISGPVAGNILNPTSPSGNITGLVQGLYSFEFKAFDNNGALAKDTMQVRVNGINLPPVVNAGANQSITLPVSTIFISGIASDPEGGLLSIVWRKITGPPGDIVSNPNNLSTNVSNLSAGMFTYELKATDNHGFSSRDTLILNVLAPPPANIPPVVNAGSDQRILFPASVVTLYGTATDADGTVTACRWRLLSGSSASFSSVNSLTLTLTNLQIGSYYLELSATDNVGASSKDTVEIEVLSQPAHTYTPIAMAGDDINVDLPAYSVTLSGAGTDPANLSVNYRWNVISAPANYLLFDNTHPNVTISNLQPGIYALELTVTNSLGFNGKDTTQVVVHEPVHTAFGIKTYPNPVSNILHISVAGIREVGKANIVIYDLKGLIVIKKEIFAGLNTTVHQIPVQRLTSGIYVVKLIMANGSTATEKIIRL